MLVEDRELDEALRLGEGLELLGLGLGLELLGLWLGEALPEALADALAEAFALGFGFMKIRPWIVAVRLPPLAPPPLFKSRLVSNIARLMFSRFRTNAETCSGEPSTAMVIGT